MMNSRIRVFSDMATDIPPDSTRHHLEHTPLRVTHLRVTHLRVIPLKDTLRKEATLLLVILLVDTHRLAILPVHLLHTIQADWEQCLRVVLLLPLLLMVLITCLMVLITCLTMDRDLAMATENSSMVENLSIMEASSSMESMECLVGRKECLRSGSDEPAILTDYVSRLIWQSEVPIYVNNPYILYVYR